MVELPEQAEGMKAIDMSFVNKTEAWIEVKQILLKHFLPETWTKLTAIIS